MANRYWVGGTNTWNTTAGTKWATTSGGAGGAAVPTTSDDVFFDAASGAVTVTTSNSSCNNLTLTGFTGTLTTASVVAIHGHVVLATSATLTASAGSWRLRGSSNQNFTSNGKTVTSSIQKDTGAGIVQLQDAFVSSSTVLIIIGGLNTNNHNFTAWSLYLAGSSTRSITLGSSTITLTATSTSSGANKWDATSTGLTFSAGTSTIKFTGTPTGNFIFNGAGLTYYNVEFDHPHATNYITITGSNTFNDLKIAPNNITKFTDGTTQTVSSFTCAAGTQRTLTGSSTGGWSISKSSGTVSVSNCTISYSTATGGATWEAYTTDGNTDGGNNNGWLFSPPSTFTPSPMMSMMAQSGGLL